MTGRAMSRKKPFASRDRTNSRYDSEMASLRDYFDSDFRRVKSVGNTWKVGADQQIVELTGRVHLDFDSGTRYLSFYIPQCADPLKVCSVVVGQRLRFLADLAGAELRLESPGEPTISSSDLTFSGRIYVYSEAEIPADAVEQLAGAALS